MTGRRYTRAGLLALAGAAAAGVTARQLLGGGGTTVSPPPGPAPSRFRIRSAFSGPDGWGPRWVPLQGPLMVDAGPAVLTVPAGVHTTAAGPADARAAAGRGARGRGPAARVRRHGRQPAAGAAAAVNRPPRVRGGDHRGRPAGDRGVRLRRPPHRCQRRHRPGGGGQRATCWTSATRAAASGRGPGGRDGAEAGLAGLGAGGGRGREPRRPGRAPPQPAARAGWRCTATPSPRRAAAADQPGRAGADLGHPQPAPGRRPRRAHARVERLPGAHQVRMVGGRRRVRPQPRTGRRRVPADRAPPDPSRRRRPLARAPAVADGRRRRRSPRCTTSR